jgi:hypothetical protein
MQNCLSGKLCLLKRTIFIHGDKGIKRVLFDTPQELFNVPSGRYISIPVDSGSIKHGRI